MGVVTVVTNAPMEATETRMARMFRTLHEEPDPIGENSNSHQGVTGLAASWQEPACDIKVGIAILSYGVWVLSFIPCL